MGRRHSTKRLRPGVAVSWAKVWPRAGVALLALCSFGTAVSQLGVPFSGPTALNANASVDSEDDTRPSLVTDRMGTWVAIWQSPEELGALGPDLDILMARSTDNGVTWSLPAALNSDAAVDSQTATESSDTRPRGSTDAQGNWLVVWQREPERNFSDIMVSRSIDGGWTWSDPVELSDPPPSANLHFARSPAITTDGSGNWIVVWSGFEYLLNPLWVGDEDIFFSSSNDNGLSWSAPAVLNTNAVVDSADDSFPAIGATSAGLWMVAWGSRQDLGNGIGPDEDILFSTSMDAGVSWSPPSALNTNADSDVGQDMFPSLTHVAEQTWVAGWTSNEDLAAEVGTDYDVLFSRTVDNGATWSSPQPLNGDADADAADDCGPEVATDGSGFLVAGWIRSTGPGGTSRSFVSRSSDQGQTWVTPDILNDLGGSDDREGIPTLANDGAGNWLVAWSSSSDFDGMVGGDRDILMSAFMLDYSDQDVDGVLDVDDNCPSDFNPDQVDFDGDLVGDSCDCAPTDGSVTALPPEVGALTFQTWSTISWEPFHENSVYDVLVGMIDELPVGSGALEECPWLGLATNSIEDIAVPAAGEGYYYLVQERNVCGGGGFGAQSTGQPRAGAVCP